MFIRIDFLCCLCYNYVMTTFESIPVDHNYSQSSPITAEQRYTAGIRHRQADSELPINGSVNVGAARAEANKHKDPRERSEPNTAEPKPVLRRFGSSALEMLDANEVNHVPKLELDPEPEQEIPEPEIISRKEPESPTTEIQIPTIVSVERDDAIRIRREYGI